ncbi:Transposase [Paenimyroides ummariense]|uniref:Transposase n=1 Tax=Paenimyroides ummariense TaxID=913024 RepID=A0A1I5FF44_9FLAO|nr:transposase [Paenimyroides ummariense]SFO22357.1 Transposase [Paenimyroides ummariense]
MKNFNIGIDVCKDTLDFCMLEKDSRRKLQQGVIANKEKEILTWLKNLDKENVVVALEHTGHYGALLSWLLEEQLFTYYLINPLDLQRSLGLQRGKSDVVDAYRIADYIITSHHKLSPFKLPCESLRKLKALMTARERYVKMSVQIQNSLKAEMILSEKVALKQLIKLEQKQLKFIKNTIQDLEKQMMEIVKSSQDLNTTYTKI